MPVGLGPAKTAAHIVYALKDGGNIDSDNGKATSELVQRLKARGVDIGQGTILQACRNLEDEGIIKRDKDTKQTYAIKLKKVGKYTDPGVSRFVPTPTETSDDASYAPRRSSLEKIIDSVKRLPLSERMMVCGAIIDEAAGEMETREQRLKAALSQL